MDHKVRIEAAIADIESQGRVNYATAVKGVQEVWNAMSGMQGQKAEVREFFRLTMQMSDRTNMFPLVLPVF